MAMECVYSSLDDDEVLEKAIRDRNFMRVRVLLTFGVDPDSSGMDRSSFLDICIKANEYKLVEFLLQKGFDANAQNEEGQYPLAYATGQEHWEMAEILLKHGADPNLQDMNSDLLLNLSVRKHRTYLAQLLILKGADVNYVDEDGRSPLAIAVNKEHWYMVETLLNYEADINSGGMDCHSLLHKCVAKNEFEVARLLLEKGADANAVNAEGHVPLAIAVNKGYWFMVEILLENGGDINSGGMDCDSLLHLYAKEDTPEIVSLIVQKGANVNVMNALGQTPLAVAVLNKKWNGIRTLLENKACINLGTMNCKQLMQLCTRECKKEESSSSDSSSSSEECESQDTDEWRECCMTIMKYVLLESNFVGVDSIVIDSSLAQFWDKCKEELSRMKRSTLGNGEITLSFLASKRTENELADVFYGVEDEFVQSLDQYIDGIKDDFEIFAEILIKKLRSGWKRHLCLTVCSSIFNHSDMIKLPIELRMKIFKYLDNADIRKLVSYYQRRLMPDGSTESDTESDFDTDPELHSSSESS